ncbi:amidohydrolase family protein [Microcoleus sp. AT3-D2]|uniref:amidohydrolase family protein n=1 Tax=Microcoleus sp. AT3-D2 TaxID=2818612 RepID=UPI002FD710D1
MDDTLILQRIRIASAGKSRLISLCCNMVTVNGAKTLNLGDDNYGIDAGKPANLIVLDAEDCYDAIRKRAAVRYVISRGKLLAATVPAKMSFYSV